MECFTNAYSLWMVTLLSHLNYALDYRLRLPVNLIEATFTLEEDRDAFKPLAEAGS